MADGSQFPPSHLSLERSVLEIERRMNDLELLGKSLIDKNHPECRKIEAEIDEIKRKFHGLQNNLRRPDASSSSSKVGILWLRLLKFLMI